MTAKFGKLDKPLDPRDDPTHPFYEPDRVGPGRPPKQHRFKKGGPSPWPAGRPKKVPSLKPDVRKIFEDAINEKFEFKKGDKMVTLSKLAIGLQQLATQFAKGDRYARRDVFAYAVMLGIDLQAKEVIEEALGITEQSIVDEFLRRQQPSSAKEAVGTRVKATSDLVDDDVAKPDAASSVKSAATKTEPNRPAAPPQGGHTRESIQTERERNLAQQKERKS